MSGSGTFCIDPDPDSALFGSDFCHLDRIFRWPSTLACHLCIYYLAIPCPHPSIMEPNKMDNLLHFFTYVTIKIDLSYITMHLSINHCIAFNLYLSYKCMYRIGWGKINDFDFDFFWLSRCRQKKVFSFFCILLSVGAFTSVFKYKNH